MKYFLALFISVLTLTGCDDGDIIVDNFNFEGANVQKCSDSNVLYKINGQESLVLNTSESNFPNVEGVESYTINGSTSVQYRKYSGNASTTNVCGTPTTFVLEEWNAVGGTVQITSAKIFDTDGTTLIAYNHNIVFKNVTFNAPGKQVVYASYEFGNYRTDVTNLNFVEFDLIQSQDCPGNNLIYKYNTNKALLLDVDATLFTNAVTPVGSPRTALINTTNNKVVYRVYSGSLNNTFFCSAITPSTPTLTEEWVADNGVAATSGIITVDTETTATPGEFKHTIKLYKTTFRKGIYYYSPAPDSDYTFGVYYTN